jgi:hypothetical protein
MESSHIENVILINGENEICLNESSVEDEILNESYYSTFSNSVELFLKILKFKKIIYNSCQKKF